MRGEYYLPHGLHQPLADRGLPGGGAARHADHEGSLDNRRHLARTGAALVFQSRHFYKDWWIY